MNAKAAIICDVQVLCVLVYAGSVMHECVLYILARKLCGIIITSTVPAIIKFIILWAPIYVHVSYITLYYLCIIVYSFDLYMFIFILVDVLYW